MSINGDHRLLAPHHEAHLTNVTAARAHLATARQLSRVPAEWVTMLREGTLDSRHRIPVAGTTVTALPTKPGRMDFDTSRIIESWVEFRRTFSDANASGTDHVLHPGLPPEIATATWEYAGRRINVCQPGTPSGTLRHAHSVVRRRLAALSPVPAIAALGQNLVGGVTAAGIAVAPLMPIPDVPAQPPISLPVVTDADAHPQHPAWAVTNRPAHGAARKPSTDAPTAPAASPDPDPTRSVWRVALPDASATAAPTPVTTPETEATPTTAASPSPANSPAPSLATPTPSVTPRLPLLPPRASDSPLRLRKPHHSQPHRRHHVKHPHKPIVVEPRAPLPELRLPSLSR